MLVDMVVRHTPDEGDSPGSGILISVSSRLLACRMRIVNFRNPTNSKYALVFPASMDTKACYSGRLFNFTQSMPHELTLLLIRGLARWTGRWVVA